MNSRNNLWYFGSAGTVINSAGSSMASKNSLSSSSSLASPFPEGPSLTGTMEELTLKGSANLQKYVTWRSIFRQFITRAVPLLLKLGLLNDGWRTVAPLKARSRWLCCLANCSRVSSRRILWSLSDSKDFCQRLLWLWASERKSLHAFRNMRETSVIFHISRSGGGGTPSRSSTHVDHGVGGDPEKRGPLCDLPDLFPHVGPNTQSLQLWQRPKHKPENYSRVD